MNICLVLKGFPKLNKSAFASYLDSGMITDLQMRPSEITDDDYQHAQKVFKTFGCKNLADYTGLYCKSDVLLLADVFESFIDVCREKYNLDPAHYITLPALSWDAMLKMTGVKLELLTDADMHLFFENGIRGGVSTITNRYSKANNKYMKDFNLNEPGKYIEYLDANNLYGWAMSERLPVGGFEWLTDKDIDEMMEDYLMIKVVRWKWIWSVLKTLVIFIMIILLHPKT